MSGLPTLVPANARRQTLNLPPVQISYLEWQQGQEPVLLLHGLADCAIAWASLGEELSDNYHIIAPDLRGHGESSKPDRGYSCAEIIADLAALMDELGWTSAHVVAHSWAAKVAVVWARQQPQRFRSLVLLDPAFIDKMPGWMRVTFPFFYRVLPFLKTMGPFASYEQAQQQAQQLKQYRGWSELQQRLFQAAIEQKPDGSWGSKFVAAARDGAFEDVLSVAGLTTSIEIPTLFLQPVGGLNRTAAQLRPYRRYLKNLQVQQIPGNHWAFLVEPQAFNLAVADFLDKQLTS